MARIAPKTLVEKYKQAQQVRAPYEHDWRLAAAYCIPRQYSSWQTDGPSINPNGVKAARRIAFDSTGVRSLPKYASVLGRMVTPQSQRWHGLKSSNRELMKLRAVKMYYDDLTDVLFKLRYNPKAGFIQSSQEVYRALGVYGTGPQFAGVRKRNALDPKGGITYRAVPLRDVFILIDDDGLVSMSFRRFWLNARQFKEKFPEDTPTREVANELAKPSPSETTYFEFVHAVHMKQIVDYDKEAFDHRRFPIAGSYVAVKDMQYVGEEHGYLSWPYQIPRTETDAGDPYGFSPAQQAMPALGTASATKKSYLKQGQRATDQVLLAADDGVMSSRLDLLPGRVNYGAIDSQGRKLVHALETGNFNVAENILADERKDIEDSFFVTLFQILTETPEMSATEVIERVAEKASLLAPTMGRLQTGYTAPTIEREIDVASELAMLPIMPPELIEAEGEYEVVYTSPLAKGMYAEEIGGYMRAVEMATNIASATGDMSHLDHFDFDESIPEIADNMAAPVRWMTDADQKKAIRQNRADQAEEAKLMENSAGLASALKTASDMQGGQSDA